ncbi:sigma-70 family RNA polymerase sigma factor [Rhodocytophaga aerolata]|uniref:Sigma-70 family RNA polymerase sigma factor n=1 Tax=Rhodocytophaga aerolata TaxID=455078 RepID=A0ABT8RA67_9BACT|nr:sigma-70 family RNA polymerase sigma factor [Rhodocytophaga aerolata]MDO1448997.1 sigma-70 family RNA polymerase sigma factor [Rhodocytophaga aerolata]
MVLRDISNCTDQELWKKFKGGCEQTFSYIFHKYYSFLYNYGSKLTSDKDLIKDSIQELFIILWESRSRLGDTVSIKFYLLKSFRRHVIRTLTATTKHVDKSYLLENYQDEMVSSYERDLIRSQSCLEQQVHLQDALNKLSPRQKEVVYLKFYQNLSYHEITELTSLNYQSVRNYIHQAIQALRRKREALIEYIPFVPLIFCFV